MTIRFEYCSRDPDGKGDVMCEVLVFDVVCDKKSDADTLLTEFASSGMNAGVQRQNAIFGAGKRACEAEPLKQEAVYRVSVDIDVFDGNKKAAEQRFAAVFKEVVAKNRLRLSGEYWMRPAFYGVAFFDV